MKLPKKLAFVDVETTGSNPRGDRIMEIGILRVENNKVVATLDTLINPGVPPPEFIVNMTGINPFDLEVAPVFSSVAREVKELLNGAIFVAHNARFDYAFVKNEFLRHEISFNAKVLCTVKLARKIYPGLVKYNLDNIIDKFGIVCENRHRAYGDAKSLWDFYHKTLNNGAKARLSAALEELLKAPSIPSSIGRERIRNISDGPGVYIFRDGTSTLYVGKSVNLKDRVRSHFSSDYQSSKDIKISQHIKDIEVIETAGEMGALLRESALVKKMQPIFNRRLRKNSDMVVALKALSADYFSIKLDRMTNISADESENVVGVFRSKRKAKDFFLEKCIEHRLCPKVMGIDKSRGSCFNYQLGRCNGACILKERSLKYNIRFLEGLAVNKVQSWPFKGPIAIEENYFTFKEVHFVDKWCYLGSSLVQSNEVHFDWDVYQILKKFILKKRTDIRINNITYEDLAAATD